MQKDFDNWNHKKKSVNNLSEKKFFFPREIWWCSLGVNIGREQDGDKKYFERPIVVVKKLSPDTLLVVPMSTKKRKDDFQVKIIFNNLINFTLIDQIRVIDSKRLVRKIGMIKNSEFREIRDKINNII